MGKQELSRINLLQMGQELSKPSAEFWNKLGKESKDLNGFSIYDPGDKAISKIEIQLSSKETKFITHMYFYFKPTSTVTINNLTKLFGNYKTTVIGPSNPGYRGVSFPSIKTDNQKLSITVFAYVDGYTVEPNTRVKTLFFRRDQL